MGRNPLVFTIWFAAWQLMRRRDGRQDEASRSPRGAVFALGVPVEL